MQYVVHEGDLAVLEGGQMFPVGIEPGPDPLRRLLEAGADLVELGRAAIESRAGREIPERLDPPISSPSKIVGIGLNYLDHCRETGIDPPTSPLEFAKFPSSLTGHMHPIPLDAALSDQVDYEVELAVVIGRRCRDVAPDDVPGVVAGYTIANDVSARDLQMSEGQWVRAKSFDGFCPLGPALVTADEVPDPSALDLTTRLDEQLLQDSTTAEMIFSVTDLVSHVSRRTTLLPGDLLLTGTPFGTGGFRDPQVFLRPGTTVSCSIAGLGTLTNPIVAYD